MKSKDIIAKKIAVYCTADDKYIYPATVALGSVRKFHSECDYYVLGNKENISETKLSFLEGVGIKFIHSDKNIYFKDDVWPNTAYLMLFGPEMFYELGYDFSLNLDGDVICINELDLDTVFANTAGFSGIANKEPWHNYFKDKKFIKSRWELSEEQFRRYSTNTGVVFWNNCRAKEVELGRRSMEYYSILEASRIPVLGDQALFALTSVVEPAMPFNELDYTYNYRVGNVMDLKTDPVDVKIFHYTGLKPWTKWRPKSLMEFLFTPKAIKLRRHWHEFVRQQGIFTAELCLKTCLK